MIEFRNVSKVYNNGTEALHNINLKVEKGEFVFIVGSSGAGKSTFLKLITCEERPNEGQVLIDGQDISHIRKGKIPYVRRKMGLVFQDFRLIDHMTVYDNVAFAMRVVGASPKAIKKRVPYILGLVGLQHKAKHYPTEMSGGERQRVGLARALVNNPSMIIADEPTTALDVTVQKQVISLLNELREKLGFAMIFVSHDLALVAEVAHHITVMYAGQVIEQAPTKELLTHPTHEYTRGLLGAVLSIESGSGRLHQVPGTVPSPRDFPKGDRFAPRSSHPDYGLDIRPVLTEVGPEHVYAALPPRDEAQASAQETNGQEETR